jgi:hypothetical protein
MRKKIKHKVNAVTPRLSDEELDPLEIDDNEGISTELIEGYFPWTADDMIDIRHLIEGLTYVDIHVTEKYWRYHFSKGIEFIKKELGL